MAGSSAAADSAAGVLRQQRLSRMLLHSALCSRRFGAAGCVGVGDRADCVQLHLDCSLDSPALLPARSASPYQQQDVLFVFVFRCCYMLIVSVCGV